jgi:hypothetical protein
MGWKVGVEFLAGAFSIKTGSRALPTFYSVGTRGCSCGKGTGVWSRPHLLDFITLCTNISADHSGWAVWSMNCLHPFKHWGHEFKSHSRHGCLCLFILHLCVGSVALREVGPLDKESYRLCIGLRNWKSGHCQSKGCRAVIIVIQFRSYFEEKVAAPA